MDLENAAESAGPVRSLLEVGRNVMTLKSYSCHQRLLMIPIKGHLMPQRCIRGVFNPDDESPLSHHENLTIFQQDCAQFHATRQNKHSKHVQGMDAAALAGARTHCDSV